MLLSFINIQIHRKKQQRMGASCCRALQDPSHSFQKLNMYRPKKKHSIQQLESILNQLYPQVLEFKDEQVCLASYIKEEHKSNRKFQDPNFSCLQLSVKQSSNSSKQSNFLHKLYNYKHMGMDKVYHATTDLNAFEQHELQLCYCSAVFYSLCHHKDLKENIFITRDINKYNAYVLGLFCTGTETEVVIDDRIPLKSDGIKYAQINGKEIWPVLLEKAWCKQIGGYDKARALSPDDCFEEITGIPTQSYIFRETNERSCREMLIDAIRSGYWVCFTAYLTANFYHGLKSRQVFCLEDISSDSMSFSIRSPYLDFGIERTGKEPDGNVLLSMENIYNYFQYFTIGYYHRDFYFKSVPISSYKNEDIFYELNISKQQLVSIRFQQFYHQYLTNQVEKEIYSYSPTLLELYDYDTKMLIEDCNGFSSGVRSINLSGKIMLKLEAKKYYLRIQVDWQTPDMLHTGNIVVYSERNPSSYTLKKHYLGDNQKQFELWGELMAKSLQGTQNIFDNKEQEVQARLLQKQSRYILGIRNTSDKQSKLTVYFKGSENIKINHQNFQLQRDRLHLDLGPNEERVLELMPKDIQQSYKLAPFQVFKEISPQ